MASTYSTSLRLELMATGDQSGTWGDTTNTNLGTLLEQAITGYLSKAMADADQTLTNLNGASDEARNAVLNLTGALTAARNVVVPTANKTYLVRNSTTGNFPVTVKTSAGTGVAVYPGQTRWVACDGTNVVDYAVPKFLDSQFLLADETDITKLAAFQLSGITTGQTRTLTVPDKNGTIATTSDVGNSAQDSLWSFVVNGSMTVSQENGNTLGTTNGYFAADQWALYFTAATAAMSIQRVQIRTLANAVNQLEYKCTTAKAVLGGTDNVLISQPIEGSWFQQAGFGTATAQRLVMRFQVTLPAGLYHWHFANSASNRHCAVPFTIAGGEANTAVVKEIVIPPDTSGTWLTADGVIGIVADLVLAAGATVTGGTASTWGSTTYYAASTQFNILSSTSNVARLADVGMKLDPDATGVYGQYEVSAVDAVYNATRYVYYFGSANSLATATYMLGQCETTTVFSGVYTLPQSMAKTVSMQADGGANFAVYSAGLIRPAVANLNLLGSLSDNRTIVITATVGSGLVPGDAASLINTAGNGPRIGIFARLS